nr:transcription termination factor 5, mitochondrial isoform X1 [Onthophagus taurus]
MYINKLSTFLKCIKYAQLSQNRLNSTMQESCDTIQKCLGLSKSYALKLVKSNGLTRVDKENIIENVNLLSSLGFTKEEIINNGVLLRRSCKQLQDQCLVLKEVGFKDVTPTVLVNFRKLLYKTVKTLKNMSFLSKDCNVFANLLTHLDPKPSDFLIGYKYNEQDMVAKIHAVIIKKYLEWRLEATPTEIETTFRKYRTLNYKSFQNISENIKFALSIGFPPKKLLGFNYVLITNPNYPKTIIKEMPFMHDLDMKVAMRRYPKLATITPRNFKKIYEILKKEEFPDEFIKHHMNVFCLSPKTVLFRLNELKRTPELNILRGNPNILKLIVHYNRTRYRMSIMKDMDLKCFTVNPLEKDDEELFDNKMKLGNDMNAKYDVILLLKGLLNADKDTLKNGLKKHPHYLEIPLLEIKTTVKFLQKNFSNEAILNVLPIVLYPISKIRDALRILNLMKDLSYGNLSETNKLNLILYIIEKSHHFTGDGVWTNK